MTEDEAKTKWCPSPGNREAEHGGPHAMCIASACMAWRFLAARETLRNYHDAPEVQGSWREGRRLFPHGWQYEHTDIDRDGRKFDLLHRPAEDGVLAGFCGLAGAPQ